MRVRSLGLLAVPVASLACALAACGTDSTTATPAVEAGVPVEIGGADAGPTTPPVTYPAAKGDPCRGTPLPGEQHFVAAGLCARLVANDGVAALRQISFAPNGDLLGTTAGGAILLLRDDDGDGFFTKSEIHAWASTGGNGNNAQLDVAGGFVYAGGPGGVKRFAYDATKLAGGAAEDVVVNQPDGGHGKHTTHVYDGFLYVHSGSAGNAVHESGDGSPAYDTKRSLIKRFDLAKLTAGKPFDWSEGEPFTLGLRNVNGFTRNETTKKIYGVVNGLDGQVYKGVDVHNDNPGEQILEIASGKAYGYPFCFTAQRVVDGNAALVPGTQLVNVSFAGNPHDDAWCAANSTRPTGFVQAHSAPLDIGFFDQQPMGALPEKWRGGAFIAFHGSWDRDPPTGYKVVWQPFQADGTAPTPTSTKDTTTFPYEVVFGAGKAGSHTDGAWAWTTDKAGDSPRPTGVAVSPIDGALYIASDTPGTLYRVGLKL